MQPVRDGLEQVGVGRDCAAPRGAELEDAAPQDARQRVQSSPRGRGPRPSPATPWQEMQYRSNAFFPRAGRSRVAGGVAPAFAARSAGREAQVRAQERARAESWRPPQKSKSIAANNARVWTSPPMGLLSTKPAFLTRSRWPWRGGPTDARGPSARGLGESRACRRRCRPSRSGTRNIS